MKGVPETMGTSFFPPDTSSRRTLVIFSRRVLEPDVEPPGAGTVTNLLFPETSALDVLLVAEVPLFPPRPVVPRDENPSPRHASPGMSDSGASPPPLALSMSPNTAFFQNASTLSWVWPSRSRITASGALISPILSSQLGGPPGPLTSPTSSSTARSQCFSARSRWYRSFSSCVIGSSCFAGWRCPPAVSSRENGAGGVSSSSTSLS
mmetsp:Transcript_14951/g.37264  ORF Transcript_14951/g.37264 Transcript_14951/m.37264 type:complete len:207 (-) Transcript_14951:2176-2796(-)